MSAEFTQRDSGFYVGASEIVPVNLHVGEHDVQVTPDVTGRELVSPGIIDSMSISELSMAANKGFEPHIHPYDHLLVMLEGGGLLTYDRDLGNGEMEETKLSFKAGDIVPVPGMNRHAVSAGEKGVRMLSIGSPAMHLIDPERMQFLAKKDEWRPRSITQYLAELAAKTDEA